MVEVAVGLGIPQHDIAKLVSNPETGNSISVTTLRLHFENELQRGRATVQLQVANSLLKKAVSDKHPGAVTAAIFIMKCQFKWRQEDGLRHSVDPKSAGVLVAPSAMTPEQWIALQELQNQERKPPGEE